MYNMIHVALSACEPKLDLDLAIFRCIKELLTFCVPFAAALTACMQVTSMTNRVTSSYTKLSHTPSEASTTASIGCPDSSGIDGCTSVDSAARSAMRWITCTSGRWDTPKYMYMSMYMLRGGGGRRCK